jgi:DNA-binding response OmpR family regulator
MAPHRTNPSDLPSNQIKECIPRERSRYSLAKILLVENEESLQFLYQEELKEEGYEVVLAENGKEALKYLKESSCDLIILDILMPVMDGIEALGRISARHKQIPIILHTAYTDYQNDFMTWLADAFVVKSSDLSVLKKTVKELLRKNGKEKGGQGISTQETRGLCETRP